MMLFLGEDSVSRVICYSPAHTAFYHSLSVTGWFNLLWDDKTHFSFFNLACSLFFITQNSPRTATTTCHSWAAQRRRPHVPPSLTFQTREDSLSGPPSTSGYPRDVTCPVTSSRTTMRLTCVLSATFRNYELSLTNSRHLAPSSVTFRGLSAPSDASAHSDVVQCHPTALLGGVYLASYESLKRH